jgi:hypothetical protein
MRRSLFERAAASVPLPPPNSSASEQILRSDYIAALDQDVRMFNLGIRAVDRNDVRSLATLSVAAALGRQALDDIGRRIRMRTSVKPRRRTH